jgi:hypothetical protein
MEIQGRRQTMKTPAQQQAATIIDIYDSAVKWLSEDADYPDTPPKGWQDAAFLIEQASAQAIVIDLLRYGVAELSDGELIHNSTVYAYDDRAPDWNAVITAIGWDEAQAAITNAREGA